MTTAVASRSQATTRPAASRGRRPRGRKILLHGFLIVTALLWLFPIAYALLSSFRTYAYTQAHGYLSLGGFTFSNYTDAWKRADFTQHFINTIYITVPAVLLTLFLSSCMAFVLARFSFKFNLTLLGFFLAANLLPQQALLIPLFRMFREIPLPTVMSDSGTMLNSFWSPDRTSSSALIPAALHGVALTAAISPLCAEGCQTIESAHEDASKRRIGAPDDCRDPPTTCGSRSASSTGKWLFSRADLDRWLLAGMQRPHGALPEPR